MLNQLRVILIVCYNRIKHAQHDGMYLLLNINWLVCKAIPTIFFKLKTLACNKDIFHLAGQIVEHKPAMFDPPSYLR